VDGSCRASVSTVQKLDDDELASSNVANGGLLLLVGQQYSLANNMFSLVRN
jgi:hypothetical protein